MFDKTKKFINDHREEITAAAVSTAVLVGCGVAYCCGHKAKVMKEIKSNGAMETIFHVLDDIPAGTRVRVFGAINAPGFTPNELGKIGAEMINRGADELDAFTHFIAIKKM